ncbi:olfactory receptor 4D10-like [Exaiptasia diaphana]|uniref:G-protein coupled receptors family 1 profile domain-containing protein n=1 Tax=Exaiptasia diaphana TaxID=2652724 RepID=A0A913X2Y3_EXADI|nr:olfactory receptor 4D10-like [Exaiptasia diaphana]
MWSPNCTHYLLWYIHREQLKGSSLFSVVIMGLLIVPTALLNALILLTIWRRPTFHNPSNICICNLALSDLSVAVIAIPLMITWKLYEMNSGEPSIVCSLAYSAMSLGSIVSGTSFFTLTLAILDRFLALRLHLHYRSMVTNGRVIRTCISTWIGSFIVSMSLFIDVFIYDVLVLSVMIPCMGLFVFCHYKIFRIVQHHKNQIHVQMNSPQQKTFSSLSRYKSTVSTLIYLILVFFILYASFIMFSFYHQLVGHTIFYMHGWTISIPLMYINSVCNPLIYCWKLRELRQAMKKTFFHLIGKDDVSATWATKTHRTAFN